MAEYVKYVNLNPNISSISELVDDKMFKGYGISIGRFVSITDSSGVTNLERIYERYTPADFDDDTTYETETKIDIELLKGLPEDAKNNFEPSYNLLKRGTEIVLTKSDIHRSMTVPVASATRKYVSSPFMAETYKNLLEDSGYIDVRAIHDKDFGFTDRNPRATVWVWSKSLGTGSHLSGGILDLTPFLSSVTTSKNKTTGTFTVSLAYAHDDFKEMVGSTVYESTLNRHDSQGKRRRTNSQFHSLISKNDIVFVRLSRLLMETGVHDHDIHGLRLESSDLVGRVYDMIGMVDDVRDIYGGGSDSVNVTMNGNDLTALMSGDGSSIYQNRYVSGGSTSEELELTSGIFRQWGKHSSLFALQDNPIGDQLLFILDYMTRTKICEGLFSSNPNRRTVKVDIGADSDPVNKSVDGIWQIINVAVDESVSGYTSYNTRIGNDYSPILTQLKQVCQEPFVELYTDTYQDRFYVMARKPIFDKASVREWANNENIITIKEADIHTDSLEYDKRAYSWYKINLKYLSDAFDEDVTWLIPAKYFQPYADIFGDSPMQVDNPYIVHEMAMTNDEDASRLGRAQIEAGLKDFRYLIETCMYLPFTRMGNMTIDGRREIKRGIWIYNESSDEIVYVDGVSHNQTYRDSGEVDWTTTLTLERAMRMSDIDRYFGLIDMPIGTINNNSDFAQFITETLMNWEVNSDDFEYFIHRDQYGKKNR